MVVSFMIHCRVGKVYTGMVEFDHDPGVDLCYIRQGADVSGFVE